MTNILETANEFQRKVVEDSARRARSQPFAVVLGEVLNHVVGAHLLYRMGSRFGVPLRRRHWFLLLSYFGTRSEAYKMLYRQQRESPDVVDEFSKLILAALKSKAKARPTTERPDEELARVARRMAKEATRNPPPRPRPTGPMPPAGG